MSKIIDFHSHILPKVDDGADNIATTMNMLFSMKRHGVDIVFATPHFYAFEEYPADFLKRLNTIILISRFILINIKTAYQMLDLEVIFIISMVCVIQKN